MPEPTKPPLLNIAITRTYQQLPSLVGADFPFFDAELKRLSRRGSNQEVLILFSRYPAAYDRLLTNLLFLAVALDATDDPIFDKMGLGVSTSFECPEGPHEVEAKDVKDQTVNGDALCPVHQKTMVPVGQP